MEPEYQRETTWETVASGTLEAIASLVDDLMAVVDEVGPAPVGCEVWARYPSAIYRTANFSEFKESAVALSREDVYLICLIQAPAAENHESAPPELSVAISLRNRSRGPLMDLTVRGARRTVVEGVNVRAKELVDTMVTGEIDAARAAEAATDATNEERNNVDAAKRRQPTKLAEEPPASRDSWSRLFRVLDSPWTVQIVGGVVAAVIAGIALVIVL